MPPDDQLLTRTKKNHRVLRNPFQRNKKETPVHAKIIGNSIIRDVIPLRHHIKRTAVPEITNSTDSESHPSYIINIYSDCMVPPPIFTALHRACIVNCILYLRVIPRPPPTNNIEASCTNQLGLVTTAKLNEQVLRRTEKEQRMFQTKRLYPVSWSPLAHYK